MITYPQFSEESHTSNHYVSETDQSKYARPEVIVDLEVQAGETILLHNFLMHRSGINRTKMPRRALSVAYMDAATKVIADGATFPKVFGIQAL